MNPTSRLHMSDRTRAIWAPKRRKKERAEYIVKKGEGEENHTAIKLKDITSKKCWAILWPKSYTKQLISRRKKRTEKKKSQRSDVEGEERTRGLWFRIGLLWDLTILKVSQTLRLSEDV